MCGIREWKLKRYAINVGVITIDNNSKAKCLSLLRVLQIFQAEDIPCDQFAVTHKLPQVTSYGADIYRQFPTRSLRSVCRLRLLHQRGHMLTDWVLV